MNMRTEYTECAPLFILCSCSADKMSNLTHHQRNADENLSETSFTPVRTAIIRQSRNSKCRWGPRGIGLLGMGVGAVIIENSIKISLKLKTELPYLIQQFYHWVYTQKRGNIYSNNKKTCNPILISALVKIVKILN